jgi:hypothetical protein
MSHRMLANSGLSFLCLLKITKEICSLDPIIQPKPEDQKRNMNLNPGDPTEVRKSGEATPRER